MTETTMTLKKAVTFAKTNKLADYGFIVSFFAENPTDSNGEFAFGIFQVYLPSHKKIFRCNVEGEFIVVSADSVIVRIS
jgi:hypothetical protein